MRAEAIVKLADLLGVRAKAPKATYVLMECFPQGTKVLTDKGVLPIESVSIGTRVLSLEGGFQPVVALHQREYSGILVKVWIRGLNYDFEMTAKHRVPVFVAETVRKMRGRLRQRENRSSGTSYGFSSMRMDIDSEICEARNLSVGDFLSVPLSPDSGEETVVLDVDKYIYRCPMPKGGVRVPKIKVPTEYCIDGRLSYLLGLWVAEGSVLNGSGRPVALDFAFRMGEPAVARCVRLVRDLFGIDPAVYEKPEEHSCVVRVHDWLLSRWFPDIMGCGAENKRVPEFIFGASADVLRDFVEGIHAGDNDDHAKRKKKYEGSWHGISTISEHLSYQIPILLAKLGVACRRVRRAERKDFAGVKHRTSWGVFWSLSQWHCAGRRLGRNMGYPIRQVESRVGKEIVYNLTVAVDETYTIGSLAVKNCPLAPVTHKTGTDNTPSLSVLVKDGDRSGWICHSCGAKGTLPGLVVQWAVYFNKDPGPALDLINQEENSVEAVCGRIDHRWDEKWKERDTAAVAGVDFEVFGEVEIAPFMGKVPKYIIDRGFSLETCKAWQLGFDKEWKDTDGNRRPRLTIPIRRKDGKLVGMVGRALDDGKGEKYWNYWHFHKSRFLFGQDRTEQEKTIISVVEGYLDVIRWWEYGINVVGIMGSHPSDEQVRLLSCYEDIFLALDKDDAGFKGRDEIAAQLKNRVALWDTEFPAGKTDPKQLTKEEAEYCLLHAKKII